MVPYITPYITKKQKPSNPGPWPCCDHCDHFFHVVFQSRYFASHIHHHLGSESAAQKIPPRPPGGNFHQPHAEKYGHQIGSFPPFKEWKWKILQTTAQIQVHETVIRRMHPEPPNSCFFSERSLIIKDMLGIYIVYIKPMTIRSWIPFEAKHIGCMHATVKCQNHWCTNFFTSSHIL